MTAKEYLERLEKDIEAFQQIYADLAISDGDNLLPEQLRIMKMFALKDLLGAFNHFQTYKNLLKESFKIAEAEQEQEQSGTEPKNYNVSINDSTNIEDKL